MLVPEIVSGRGGKRWQVVVESAKLWVGVILGDEMDNQAGI